MTAHSSLGVEKNELEAVNQNTTSKYVCPNIFGYIFKRNMLVYCYNLSPIWCNIQAFKNYFLINLNKSTCELEGEWERVGLYHYHFKAR